MSSITIAKASPRLENGKIIWYEGDTFAIKLNIDLTSTEDGNSINLTTGDEIIVSFYRTDICVHKFVFNTFVDNTIILDFDENVTKKFNKGNYTYIITYKNINRTTIVANSDVEVE